LGNRQKLKTMLIIGFSTVSLLTIGGCAKWASPDDLQKLEAARKSVQSAEKELADLKAERRQLETEKQAKTLELEQAKAELQQVKTP